MEEILYLESDEEIISVIDRIKKTSSTKLGLVVPREATLLQSVVNLRLLVKEAESLNKEISIVTTDRIGRNLAAQIGLPVYNSVKENKPSFQPARPIPSNEEIIEISIPKKEEVHVPAGIKVRHFQENPPAQVREKQTEQADEVKDEKTEIDDTPFQNKRIIPVFEHEELENDEYEEMPKNSKVSGSKTKESFRTNKEIESHANKAVLPMLGILLILAAVAGFLLLPKTSIKISVLSEDLKKTIPVVVSTQDTTNPEKNILKGELVELSKELQGKYSTTGKKNIGEKARGTITVYNSWDSSPHTFPVDTKILSSGKTFYTVTGFTVPGYVRKEGKDVPGSVTVQIEAEKPGEEYNVKSGKFAITGVPVSQQEAIYGTSAATLSGGFSKQVQTVSKEDYENAQKRLTDSLIENANRELRTKTQDKQILDKAIIIDDPETTSTAKIDQEAKEFEMTVKVKARLMVFDFPQLKDLLTKILEEKVPSDKMVAIPSDRDMGIVVDAAKYDDGKLNLISSVSAKVASKVSEDKIKSAVLGKKEKDAYNLLKEQEGISKVEIQFSPEWLKRVPDFERNVKVEIEYLTGSA